MIERREFVTVAGGAITTTALATPDRFGWTTAPNWFDKPMRWAQMVFNEDDRKL